MIASRAFLLVTAALLCMECCYSATIPQTFDPNLNDDVIMTPKKRPFCNAFTGCGRKRSQTPGMPPQELFRPRQYIDDEAAGSFIDNENAIDDLSRQIVSVARLWEAIQEANSEVSRRKQKDLGFGSQ